MFPVPTMLVLLLDLSAKVHAFVRTKYIKALLRSWLIIGVLLVVWSFTSVIPGAEISIELNGEPMPDWKVRGVCLVGEVWLSFVLAVGFLWVVRLMTGDEEYAGPVQGAGNGA